MLLQLFQARMIVGPQQLGALLHHLIGSPGLGIDDVGILERLFHGSHLAKAPTGGLGILPGHFDHVRDQVIPLWMGQGHVHAKAGHQADDALRYGERLAVARGVGPGHGNLLALEVLEAAEVLLQPGEISHGLGRVINVALQVDQRRALGQHSLLEPFVERGAHFTHVGVAGPQVHVVANADGIGAKRDHVGGFTHRLAVGNLGLALVQILLGQAQQVEGGGVGEAGTGGVVAKHRDAKTGIEQLGGDVFGAQSLEGLGQFEHQRQLLRGLLPGQQEVFFMQVGLEFIDLFD